MAGNAEQKQQPSDDGSRSRDTVCVNMESTVSSLIATSESGTQDHEIETRSIL
jgi:hypothetical protein